MVDLADHLQTRFLVENQTLWLTLGRGRRNQLGRTLNRHSRCAGLVNLCMPGEASDQNFRFLLQLAEIFHPKVSGQARYKLASTTETW